MTVASEIANSSYRFQYVLSIEGVGWPDDEYSPGGDWDGTVFTTNDPDSGLAAELGCSIHKGLKPPSSVSSEMDPVTLEFRQGGATFEILDLNDDLDTTFQPFKQTLTSDTETLGKLNAGVVYTGTTVDIAYTNPGGSVSPMVQNDVAFIGGREAVLLGGRSSLGGDVYRYSNCTRAYVGTRRGNLDPRAPIKGDEHYWFPNTLVYPHSPYWKTRRIILWARIPGEDSANMIRLFTGSIKRMHREDYGTRWVITSDAALRDPDLLVKPRLPRGWTISSARNYYHPSPLDSWDRPSGGKEIFIDPGHNLYDIGYLGTLYAYRNRVAGGVNGAAAIATAGAAATPQSTTQQFSNTQWETTTTARNVHLSGRPVLIDGKKITRVAYQPPNNSDQYFINTVVLSAHEHEFGEDTFWEPTVDALSGGKVPILPLIDNLLDDEDTSVYMVNDTVRRNPLDVFLIHLTSQDSAFFRADAASGGGTTTVNFTAPGWSTDEWVGYSLHAVEGTNAGQSRVITANTSTAITVGEGGFPFFSHSGNEYQIRATNYDVLPLGWGMCARPNSVDVDEIERVRDTYLATAEVGRFVLGDDPEVDTWKLMTREVLNPFGCFPYLNSAGKISVRFVGHALDNGVEETYASVSESGLHQDSIRTIDMQPRDRVSKIALRVRLPVALAARPRFEPLDPLDPQSPPIQVGFDPVTYVGSAPTTESAAEVVFFEAVDLPYGQPEEDLIVSAVLNDTDSLESISAIINSRLSIYTNPPPETDITFAFKHLADIYVGALVQVSSAKLGAFDPYAVSDDWSSQVCRILSMVIDFKNLALRCRVQILPSVPGAKIAPAFSGGFLSGTMTKVTGPTGVTGDAGVFVQYRVPLDPADGHENTDLIGFAVNDRIELRDINGAYKEGPFVIQSFGDNESSTPEGADADRINLDSAVSGTLAAGDYFTFAPWSASNTSNMNGFAAYADGTNEELGSGDSPKRYT